MCFDHSGLELFSPCMTSEHDQRSVSFTIAPPDSLHPRHITNNTNASPDWKKQGCSKINASPSRKQQEELRSRHSTARKMTICSLMASLFRTIFIWVKSPVPKHQVLHQWTSPLPHLCYTALSHWHNQRRIQSQAHTATTPNRANRALSELLTKLVSGVAQNLAASCFLAGASNTEGISVLVQSFLLIQ